MAKQTINRGTTANDGTGDTLRTAAQKINENFTELYNRTGSDSAQVFFDSDALVFEGATADDYEFRIKLDSDPVSDITMFLPVQAASGNDFVFTAGEQNLRNKTFEDPILKSPQINATGNTYQITLGGASQTADRSVNFPDNIDAVDTFILADQTQTLTDKTLTQPMLTDPKIGGMSGGGHIQDSNGNKVLGLLNNASAVNHVRITNNASGSAPEIATMSHGLTDSDVNLSLATRGNGVVHVDAGFAFEDETITGSDSASLGKTLTVFNSGSAITPTLSDGTIVGQLKYFVNKNVGAATITPDNFGPGSSIAITNNETATLIWDGANWQVQATYGGTVA